MSKFKLLLLIGAVVSVTACGGAPTTPVPTGKAAAPAPTAVVAAPPTATKPAAAAPTSAAPPTTAPAQSGGGLAVTPAGPAAPPKLDPAGLCKASNAPKPVANFPASLPTDHTRGSDKAQAVLYEYSDFQ